MAGLFFASSVPVRPRTGVNRADSEHEKHGALFRPTDDNNLGTWLAGQQLGLTGLPIPFLHIGETEG